MTYTKEIALHDKITIDGTDVSNGFKSFGLTSDASQVDVSGFSVSGNDENLAGPRAQSFSGDAFATVEMRALLWPLHNNRTVFEVEWQPNGLIDNSEEVYYGNCQLLNFDPTATRGDARVMTCTFVAADDAGITNAAAT